MSHTRPARRSFAAGSKLPDQSAQASRVGQARLPTKHHGETSQFFNSLLEAPSMPP